VGPEPTKIEWALQLGLIEADYIWSVVLQEIVDDFLFALGVETPHVEGN
jgi:hypothetical protein